jgi:hypothetical protein
MRKYVRGVLENHSQPGASLHQIKEVYVAGSESQMDHLLIWVEIRNLVSCTNNSQSHIISNLPQLLLLLLIDNLGKLMCTKHDL